MLLDWAKANVWVTVGIWTLLYISDYALTLIGARLRAARVPNFSTQGSYELNSYYVQDIDRRRMISPRFLIALFLSSGLIAITWFYARQERFLSGWFEFAFGAMVLMELTIHIRHLRNIFSFRRQMVAGEMAGTIPFSRRYIYWTSALDLALFAVFYLLLFLFVGHVFFFGGALTCGSLAIRHRLHVRREAALAAT